MIQVLNRALDIIELISKDTNKTFTLSEIADELQLNHATCANIIKTMVTRNFIEQVGPKKGYKLGYMLYQIVGDKSFEEKLKKAATHYMSDLTKKLSENSLLAILKGRSRLIVHEEQAEHELMVRSAKEKDVYNSASGRLLVALLPEKEQEAFIARYGIPSKDIWPEAATKKGLQQALDAIRACGYARQATASHIIGLACGLLEDGRVIASLSVYLPASRMSENKEKEIIQELQNTASLLEEHLRQ